jgi:transposase
VTGNRAEKCLYFEFATEPNGQVLIRRQVRRSEVIGFFCCLPPCLIGMEACFTAHFWGRELAALDHEVRLMPAAYVKMP